MAARPNLGLIVEITTADGTRYQWGKGSNAPGDVPQGLGFSTRLGDGFADGTVTLNRRIDRDWGDINLYDDVAFVGYDGSVAYEGRVAANPRSISTNHSMSVVCAGWMAHTRDRKMQEIYIDRDLSRWRGPSVSRQVAAVTGNYGTPGGPSVTADVDGGTPALLLDASGAWTTTSVPLSEAFYDSPVPIAAIYYDLHFAPVDANWDLRAGTWSDDKGDGGTTLDRTGDLQGSSPGYFFPTSGYTLGALQLFYAAGVAGGADNAAYQAFWRNLTVYGNHGIPLTGTTDPKGFYASDIIAHVIATFCPLLNAGGVQGTTYVIPQAAYPDPTDPFDVIADVNKYHRWQFYVWENKTFYYQPIDLSDYDWAIDYFDPGVTIDLQGDSTDDGAFNGICVNYTDLQTGKPNRVTPDTNTELADSDPENPANRRGIDHWDEISLSSPTTSDGAVQIGRAALAEKNTPKGQGSITVKGHVKDRAGHWQQGWKVRAGDRAAIVSSTSLSDRPRLISETSWDHDSQTLTITVESPPARLDAVLDRIQTALGAAGLS